MGFRIFMVIDMSNAFPQFPLTEKSSKIFAVYTPWGLVKPQFLPEGGSQESEHLQAMVVKNFGTFCEWSIVIFNNIFLLAHDEVNAARKFRVFLKKCAELNVFLKPSKC